MERATPDGAIADAIERATPESIEALREALGRIRSRTVRERWLKSGSKLTFKAWCELEGLCTRW